MHVARATSAMVCIALCSACLVADPRPEPGSVLITASSDEPLRRGFTTADGWTIHYDRFLVSVGNASPEGDQCTFYSDTAYDRVLNMLVAGPQKVSIIYALGSCAIDFEVSNPSSDSVLGAGVTSADRDFMRTPASDDQATESGVSVFVQGVAQGHGMQKRFAWAFRHRLELTNCSSVVAGAVVKGVSLRSREAATRDLTFIGSALFRARLGSDEADLFFGPFAGADKNGDGVVSLEELGAVTLQSLAATGKYVDGAPEWKSLEEYLYLGLSTNVVRYQGNGTCEEKLTRFNDRAPH